MNYANIAYSEFYNEALKGVKNGWLNDDKTRQLVDGRIKIIHDMSKNFSANCNLVNFCPQHKDIFRILKIVRPEDVKVVIIGQDPYPRLEHAVGIAFQAGKKGEYAVSVEKIRHNLIYHGHIEDIKYKRHNIRKLAHKGVLLINKTFTCEEGDSGSHITHWEGVIESILKNIPRNSVALLLGNDAQLLSSSIHSKYKISHCHPADRQDKFKDVDVFGEANKKLIEMGMEPIDWKF